jgi:hypothetical protein
MTLPAFDVLSVAEPCIDREMARTIALECLRSTESPPTARDFIATAPVIGVDFRIVTTHGDDLVTLEVAFAEPGRWPERMTVYLQRERPQGSPGSGRFINAGTRWRLIDVKRDA